MTPIETLSHIQQRLATESPGQVVEALVPCTPSVAVTWARRLPGWDEYQFPDQVVAVARIISQRAMREFGLKLTEVGRVAERVPQGWQDRKPEQTFKLAIAGEELKVEYTHEYFPGSDLFSFLSPRGQAHCLSASGFWCPFIPSDVVDALGGPEAFAAIYADAKLKGTEKELLTVFEGNYHEVKPRRKPSRPNEQPPVGEHTSRVVAEPETPGKWTVQGRLF